MIATKVRTHKVVQAPEQGCRALCDLTAGGAVIGAAVLFATASGSPEFDLAKGFAANGYGEHSPGMYNLFSAMLAEVVLTMMFLFIIMGATHGKAPVVVCSHRDCARVDPNPSCRHSDHEHV